jgi:hypothetical protein
MRALFGRSRFGATPVDVRFEEAGVNLFAFCNKGSADERPSRQLHDRFELVGRHALVSGSTGL